jgi:ribosomal protein S18 acetylase RimI-like enzyme
LIKATPWDSAAFDMPTFELTEYTEASLDAAARTPGHYTIKVDPLANKALLHAHGFYYCDTLLATSCTAARLPALEMPPGLHVSATVDPDAVLAICHGAFSHGRFHRDFLLSPAHADLRYDNWLRQLLDAGKVVGLLRGEELGGFIGITDNSLVLHAVAPSMRGQGLAKYWWHAVISVLFAAGNKTVTSSISASNVAVVNLYASLGFSFLHPQDIYHRIIT